MKLHAQTGKYRRNELRAHLYAPPVAVVSNEICITRVKL
jgi:hypothetical protein